MTYDQVLQWGGGTQVRLAARLGISQSTVSAWKGKVPADYQFRIHVLSGAALMVDPELLPQDMQSAPQQQEPVQP